MNEREERQEQPGGPVGWTQHPVRGGRRVVHGATPIVAAEVGARIVARAERGRANGKPREHLSSGTRSIERGPLRFGSTGVEAGAPPPDPPV